MKTSTLIILVMLFCSIVAGFYSGAFINKTYYEMKIKNITRELKTCDDSLKLYKNMYLKCNGQLIEISNDPVWKMYIDNTTPEITN